MLSLILFKLSQAESDSMSAESAWNRRNFKYIGEFEKP